MARGRTGASFVAQLVPVGRGVVARPAFEMGPDAPLLKARRGDAQVGDLVTVRLRGGGCEVTRVHGPGTSAGAAIAALMVHEGLGRGFGARVREEADRVARESMAPDADRRDLRDQRVITIDPAGAKDHDDAIAVEREGEGIHLWVHIADVSRFVAAGGAIDTEAERRGCSTYLPGTVDPMLPERLSNDVCSLRPNEDRKALTAHMLVMPDGAVSAEGFHRSLIRSDRRLTYPEVDALLEGRADLGDEAMEADVRLAMELARALRARRMRRGALDIVTTEPRFVFDGPRVVGVEREEATDAHSLIEECMVAANEAVARFLISRTVPTIFRVHGDPAQVAIENLWARLEVLGVAVPPLADGVLTADQRREAAGVAAHALRMHSERMDHGGTSLSTMVLRALQRAIYRPDETAHSGLASPAYLHFTSPIRRYPDLVVHRALVHALGLGEPFPDVAALPEVARAASERERDATDLERRADRMCLAYLLVQTMVGDNEWDRPRPGEVQGIGPAGLFITFDRVFDGFLPFRRMHDDHYVADATDAEVIGEDTGRRIRLGDVISVRVHDVEPLRGRVTLDPADRPGPSTTRVTSPMEERRRSGRKRR
ncbi:MAG: RNB domain-containing ribonuclease [Thermoleophilia bacterium]|nr:RNB domain-containing ribonuclease [Thermoleophilia bacterium]